MGKTNYINSNCEVSKEKSVFMDAVRRDVQVLLSEILINLIPLLITFYLKLSGNIPERD